MGVDSWLRGSGYLGRCRGFNSPVNQLPFCFRIAIILATIGPRSWSRSFIDRRLLEWWRFHHISSPITARSCRNRGSIEPRSWSSSTIILRCPMEIQRSGEVHALPQLEEIGTIEVHPMEIVRSPCIHAMPPIAKNRDRLRSASNRGRSWPSTTYLPSRQITSVRWSLITPSIRDKNWMLLVAPRVTRYAVDRVHLIAIILARAWSTIAWTRVHAI